MYTNGFLEMADRLDRLADNLSKELKDGLKLFGLAMVEYLNAHSPVDTGFFAESWRLEEDGDGWLLVNDAGYGSFIHSKGDQAKVPIYPELIQDAVVYAAEKVNMNAVLNDITAAYIGKGFKLLPHNAIWLALTGKVSEDWADNRPVVPTVNVPAGQAGTITVAGARGRKR